MASLGLEILAFPCNQFGEEEPGSNDQIQEFVCTRFKSEFPIFDKVNECISFESLLFNRHFWALKCQKYILMFSSKFQFFFFVTLVLKD